MLLNHLFSTSYKKTTIFHAVYVNLIPVDSIITNCFPILNFPLCSFQFFTLCRRYFCKIRVPCNDKFFINSNAKFCSLFGNNSIKSIACFVVVLMFLLTLYSICNIFPPPLLPSSIARIYYLFKSLIL